MSSSDVPMVSVVIPAYNAERTLPQTIQSVLSQSFRDVEVLVIDDGSTDRTREIAASFGPPVRCLEQSNQGVSVARNRGIQLASGRYIALLDADDTWESEKLRRQLDVLEADPSVTGVYVGVLKVSAEGHVIEHLSAREFDDPCRSLLLHSSVIPASSSSLLLRRDAFERIGLFDPAFSQCADWDFMIRASLRAKLAPIDEWLVRYRSAVGNMSSNITLLESDTFAVLDKFYSSTESSGYQRIKDRVYSNHWLILSGSYLHDHQVGNAVRCLTSALCRDPRNLVYPIALPLRLLKRARRQSSN